MTMLAEVAALAEQGVREVTCWVRTSTPTAARCDGNITDLALLIRAIAQIDGIGRIRFTTSHPLEFSDSRWSGLRPHRCRSWPASAPGAVRLDHILAAMKRGYTALSSSRRSASCARARQFICISSDFIVGFRAKPRLISPGP